MMQQWRFAGVVSTAALGIFVFSTAYAELAAPKVRARSRRDDTIRVSWGGVKSVSREAITVVELERALDDGAFEPVGTFPKRPRRIEDLPGGPGVYTYRARVLSDDQVSPWSEYAVAEVLPRPTATPTPTPEVTPDGGGDSDDPPLKEGQRECPDGTLDGVLALVNDARRTAGAPALQDHAALRRAARTQSIRLAQDGVLSHGNWVDVIRAAGYRGTYAAENIAYGYASPGAVVNGWLGSPLHRANMLNSIFRDSGIGCVIDQNGRYWWAHDLGG
jgi:uncharacterized protein YkwD